MIGALVERVEWGTLVLENCQLGSFRQQKRLNPMDQKGIEPLCQKPFRFPCLVQSWCRAVRTLSRIWNNKSNSEPPKRLARYTNWRCANGNSSGWSNGAISIKRYAGVRFAG